MNVYRWSDLEVGLAQSFEVAVTSEMMTRFRALSGDVNPLHEDASFAREHGFDDAVVFGLLTSAFYSTLVGVHLPGRHVLLHGINVDFVKPVYVGDSLRISGEITHLSDAYRRAEIAATITTARVGQVSKAKIRVGLNA